MNQIINLVYDDSINLQQRSLYWSQTDKKGDQNCRERNPLAFDRDG